MNEFWPLRSMPFRDLPDGAGWRACAAPSAKVNAAGGEADKGGWIAAAAKKVTNVYAVRRRWTGLGSACAKGEFLVLLYCDGPREGCFQRHDGR